MKAHRALPALLMLPLLLASSGCLKLVANLTINKDSSGRIAIQYSINEDSVSQAKGLIALKDQLTFSDSNTRKTAGAQWIDLFLTPTENGFRNRFKAYEKLGIKLESVKVTSENVQRHVQLAASFSKLENLSRADFFHEIGLTLGLTPEGNYSMKREKLPNNASADMIMNADTIAMLAPLLKGFNVAINVTPPGKILKSNGKVTGNTAGWTFDYNANPASLLALQRNELGVEFESKGINLPLLLRR